MLNSRDTFEYAYDRDEQPHPAGDQGDEGSRLAALVRRTPARVPLRVTVGTFVRCGVCLLRLDFVITAHSRRGNGRAGPRP